MRRTLGLMGVASVVAVLAAAPGAMASHPSVIETETNIQSATLGTGGSVIVTGTTKCEPDGITNVTVTVRQPSRGNRFNVGSDTVSPHCPTTGTVSWVATVFGERRFHAGPANVTARGVVCASDLLNCAVDSDTRTVKLSPRK
jgi:hypothetical protein